jgi:glycine C-acetyltransferase
MAYTFTTRDHYRAEIANIQGAGLFKQERYIHSPQASEIEVEFPAGSAVRKCINICANNYLGLSSHPDVIAAAHAGLDARGYGMSSVRFICGTQDIHRELEDRLTDFLGTEDTLLFPSCMDANAGFFEACLKEEDVMIADRLVHASIVDGMRLAKAQQDIVALLELISRVRFCACLCAWVCASVCAGGWVGVCVCMCVCLCA